MMESGAILIYLRRRPASSCRRSERGKYDALQWLMFQMGSVGPMFGQAHHFMRAKKDEVPYGSERYGNEAKRLYGVMDAARGARVPLGASTPSPTSPRIRGWRATSGTGRPRPIPSVKRWYDAIGGARPW
jgi:GST-like protein